MSPSEMNSADDASHSCSQPENGFIDSASCVNSEKAILELELSEAWGTVEKVLRRAAEGKASAQAEAAEWKREYELERAWNRDFQRQDVEKALRRAAEGQASAQAEAAEWKRKYELERARNFQRQDKISGGNHDDDVHCKNTQNLDDQSDSCNQTNEQPERCWAEHGICSREVLVNGENDFASGAIQNRMMRKASFKLSWRCKGETSDPHKHDIVSFEEGNITTARRASKQIALKWESPPQTVLIVTKKDSDPVRARCVEIVRWLKDHKNLNIYVEPDVRSELLTDSSYFAFVQTWQNDSEIPDLHKKVDLVVTLGGDGTVLWAASMFKGAVPPVVPFALGSLGFMTPFHSERYKEHLDSILEGPINITLRHRLRCQVVRHSATNERKTEEPILVFNEVTIARGILSCLTNLECYFDDTYVTLVQGDGLILSTTSGSTAYSLAAGGSIVHPQVPGILFTPVCPHSLSFRPLILPEHFTIRVQVPLNGSSAYASFDGKRRTELAAGDALICSMGPCPVPTACLGDSTTDFLHSIQDCLHWNKRKAQSSDGPRHNCECCFLPNICSLGIGQQS